MCRMKFPIISVLLCLWFGCASPPPPPPESTEEEKNKGASAREELSGFLTSVEKSMKKGTPQSLHQAARELVHSPASQSERGEELLYIAVSLHQVFYPLLEQPDITVTVGANNIYRLIFENIRNGTLVEIGALDSSESARFFRLVSSAAVVLYTGNDEAEAAATDKLEQAAELEPASILPPYLLGVLSQRAGELEQAEQYFRKALYPDSETGESGCYPAKVGLAEVLLAREEYSDSWEITKELLDRFPRSEKLLRIAAYTHYHLGDFDQALGFVDGVLQLQDSSEMLFLRLKILWKQQKIELAKRFLAIVKKQHKTTAELACIEADILYKSGENSTALDVLDKALLSYPEEEQLLRLYNTVLFASAYAEKQWAHAAELLKELPYWESSVELLEKAVVVYRNLGMSEKTAQLAEKLLEIDSSNPAYIATYVRASLSKENNPTEAEQVELEPLIIRALENAESRKTRSDLYLLQSSLYTDPQKKLELLQNSLFEDLQNSDALVAIAAVYREIGDVPKALRYLKQAALLLPDDRAIRDKIKALEAQGE
jgi:tetratricopeptide (TPR) repeat protein